MYKVWITNGDLSEIADPEFTTLDFDAETSQQAFEIVELALRNGYAAGVEKTK